MHQAYGGVVPELASRDHIRRVLPLARKGAGTSRHARSTRSTSSPTRAGRGWPARCSSAPVSPARSAPRSSVPVLGVHHLEGHLLSPLLSADPPQFPFVALLVSGGHTQLMRVDGVGAYELLGETLDDAAGEAFDKTAKLLGLGYPGGPALARLAESGEPGRFKLPRPMLNSGDFGFSFSGLKTAVLTAVQRRSAVDGGRTRPTSPRVSGSGDRSAGGQGAGGVPPAPTFDAGRRRRRRRQPAAARAPRRCGGKDGHRVSSIRSSSCAPTTAR